MIGGTKHLAAVMGVAGALAVSAPPTEAALMAPCAEPILFPGADVNLVVLPYALGGPDEDYQLRPDLFALAGSDTASKLASLIQLDTLYSLRYPARMAVVHLTATGDVCGPAEVLPELTAQLEDGKGLVLLWGAFLEEDGEIYVQSYLEFFRKERDDTVEIAVDLQRAEARLRGRLEQHALGFPPRILTEADLEEISAAGEGARRIWSEPQGGTVLGELPDTPEQPYAYYVTAAESGWMRIAPHERFGGGEGWVHARSDWPLRRKLPELEFIDATMGYLAARVLADERRDRQWAGAWEAMFDVARARSKQAFARFRDLSSTGPEIRDDMDARVSLALSHALGGMLDLVARESGVTTAESEEDLASPAESFRRASAALPYRAEFRNLEAVARAGLARTKPEQASLAVRGWREALSLDPGNDLAAENLAAFYRLLLQVGKASLGGLDAEVMRSRLSELQ